MANQNLDAEVTEVTIDPDEIAAAEEEAKEAEGTAELTLRRPLNYEGKTFETLHFDFDQLTGRDGLRIEREVQMATGSAVLLPAYNSDYLVRMLAHSCKDGVGADGIQSLGLRDFNAAIGKARSFLLRSGS